MNNVDTANKHIVIERHNRSVENVLPSPVTIGTEVDVNEDSNLNQFVEPKRKPPENLKQVEEQQLESGDGKEDENNNKKKGNTLSSLN